MEMNKVIAQEELKMFGGTPEVFRYWNDLKDKHIDVLRCIDVPQKGIQSCASIGLNEIDVGLTSGEGELRVEILGACNVLMAKFENIVASVAFAIMDSHKCFPGYMVENVIEQYIQDCDMKHILLVNPFLWKNVESIFVNDLCVSWLMIVPVSEAEYNYAGKNGIEKLENLFVEKQIDIYNIYRESIIK